MARASTNISVTKLGYVDTDHYSSVIDISGYIAVTLKRLFDGTVNQYAYAGIGTIPSGLETKRIYEITACFGESAGWSTMKLGADVVERDFDPSVLTWANKPDKIDHGTILLRSSGFSYSDKTNKTLSLAREYADSGTAITDEESSKIAVDLLNSKAIRLYCAETDWPPASELNYKLTLYKTLTDDSNPYITVIYDDTENVQSKIVQRNCPISGYVNPRNSQTFAWYYERSDSETYYSIGEFTQASAVFKWKESSGSNWNEITVSGTDQSITIPANTFPTASTIQWYLTGTDTNGFQSQTDVYSFVTAAGTVTSSPISPISTVESNNEEITFEWSYTSDDGFQPSRYILRWREAGETEWNELVDSQTVETSYTSPANTFPAGEIQWGVLPYNIDGIAGTGLIASFISFGAPEAPTVTATEVPFLTVMWQSEDQLAYQITVDDKTYGPYYGTEKQFDLPEYLEDGTHTITVNIIGTYSLWSPGGSTMVTIANDQGEDIVLSVENGIAPRLSWTSEEETRDFLIFRDNVQIGHTARNGFNDRFAVGEHTYKVINRLPDGNYSESNEVTLKVDVDGTYVSLLSNSDWLKIKYQLKNASDQEYTESVETVYNHLAGSDYPSVSISRYREQNLKYSAVFLYVDEEDHAKFKNMLKKPVIMKFENGNMIVGVIDSWTVIHRKNYYTAYTFSLRRIEWEDYVDDTT